MIALYQHPNSEQALCEQCVKDTMNYSAGMRLRDWMQVEDGECGRCAAMRRAADRAHPAFFQVNRDQCPIAAAADQGREAHAAAADATGEEQEIRVPQDEHRGAGRTGATGGAEVLRAVEMVGPRAGQ